MTTTLTENTFKETVLADGIVLVDFWASWCGPCRAFAPVFEKASEDNPDIVFGKIDTEQEMSLSGELGISSIPTLMIFRDGILVYSRPGALGESALNQLIQDTRDLDMVQVKAELDGQSE